VSYDHLFFGLCYLSLPFYSVISARYYFAFLVGRCGHDLGIRQNRYGHGGMIMICPLCKQPCDTPGRIPEVVDDDDCPCCGQSLGDRARLDFNTAPWWGLMMLAATGAGAVASIARLIIFVTGH
jgi:hypothetical protein